MWQSAQARPFAPNPSSFRSKNARKPRATASQGSAPQCSLPALINNVDVNTRPPATSHVDLFTDSLRSVKRKQGVRTWRRAAQIPTSNLQFPTPADRQRDLEVGSWKLEVGNCYRPRLSRTLSIARRGSMKMLA